MPFSKEMILGASGNQGAAGFYEHLMYYHEPCTSFLNRRDSFGQHDPAYKMWVSEYIYNKLKNLVPHED